MTARVRKILTIVLIVFVVAGVGLATYFLFFHNPDQSLRVKKLVGEEEGNVVYKAADYKNSALNLYPYGAFDIELIRTIGGESTLIFSGVGTYTKNKNSYTFTYTECYGLVGTEVMKLAPFTDDYTIEKGMICFKYRIVYHFGK